VGISGIANFKRLPIIGELSASTSQSQRIQSETSVWTQGSKGLVVFFMIAQRSTAGSPQKLVAELLQLLGSNEKVILNRRFAKDFLIKGGRGGCRLAPDEWRVDGRCHRSHTHQHRAAESSIPACWIIGLWMHREKVEHNVVTPSAAAPCNAQSRGRRFPCRSRDQQEPKFTIGLIRDPSLECRDAGDSLAPAQVIAPPLARQSGKLDRIRSQFRARMCSRCPPSPNSPVILWSTDLDPHGLRALGRENVQGSDHAAILNITLGFGKDMLSEVTITPTLQVSGARSERDGRL